MEFRDVLAQVALDRLWGWVDQVHEPERMGSDSYPEEVGWVLVHLDRPDHKVEAECPVFLFLRCVLSPSYILLRGLNSHWRGDAFTLLWLARSKTSTNSVAPQR